MYEQSTKPNKLKEIDSLDGLISFLERKGSNHNFYHHYTDFDSINTAMKSGYWHLSLGDVMNDKQELTKGSAQKWKNIFIASFGFGENENMAMWGLYSIPWNKAVRISIPLKAMKKWIQETSQIFEIVKSDEKITYVPKWSISPVLTDIVYIVGKRRAHDSKLRWNDEVLNIANTPKLININDEPKVTGYIKNSAWAYENEVRIKVELPDNHRQKRIAIKLPDYVMESLVLTVGPWINEELEIDKLKGIPGLQLNNEAKIKHSLFEGMIDMKNHCSICRNNFDIKSR